MANEIVVNESVIAKPHHDTSWAAYQAGDKINIYQYDYSSVVIIAWQAADIESAQYFLNRFACTVDCWHDVFVPGQRFEFDLRHRVGIGYGDETATTHISFSYLGWIPDTGEYIEPTEAVVLTDWNELLAAIK